MKFEDFEVSTKLDARNESDTDKKGLLLKAYSNDPSEVWQFFLYYEYDDEEPVDFFLRGMRWVEYILRDRLNSDGTLTEYGEERFAIASEGEHDEES